MAFLPDGTMFFIGKCRGLFVLLDEGTVNSLDNPVNNLPGMQGTEGFATTADDLFCEGQAGMNGVAVDPDFDENCYVCDYPASNMTGPGAKRVLRFTVNEDFIEVSDRTDILEDIFCKPEATDQPFGGPRLT